MLKPPSERGASNSNDTRVDDWRVIMKLIGSDGFSAA